MCLITTSPWPQGGAMGAYALPPVQNGLSCWVLNYHHKSDYHHQQVNTLLTAFLLQAGTWLSVKSMIQSAPEHAILCKKSKIFWAGRRELNLLPNRGLRGGHPILHQLPSSPRSLRLAAFTHAPRSKVLPVLSVIAMKGKDACALFVAIWTCPPAKWEF